MTIQTYPSGLKVPYGFDSVGRLAWFNGNLGGSSGTVWYAGEMFYNHWGKYWKETGARFLRGFFLKATPSEPNL